MTPASLPTQPRFSHRPHSIVENTPGFNRGIRRAWTIFSPGGILHAAGRRQVAPSRLSPRPPRQSRYQEASFAHLSQRRAA